jgi:FtsP/CotA-like multicopper oxidase with cupredoxin domain
MRLGRWLTILLATLMPLAAHAAGLSPCAALDALYPQPARTHRGDNAFRPLPLYAPIRAAPGAPGTLSLAIAVDHVSSAQAGKPGAVFVGNYQVSNLPVFRLVAGPNTSAQVVNPDDGTALPISDACMASADWGYGGSQWALTQGDTLDVMLQSRLDYTGAGDLSLPTNGAVPCRASNLHTHGLLVSPYHPPRAGIGPYGDYVLDTTEPRGSAGFGSSVDDCGTQLGQTDHRGHGLTPLPLHYVTTIPGTPGVSSVASGQHPSGLFWYHPHPHGFSGSQIGGGTTGAVTIGALTDYACPDADGTPGHCTLTNSTIRVLALKDMQIVHAGNAWTTITDPESGLCAPTGGARHGECAAVTSEIGPAKWVFTINGVQFPVVHIPAGRMEIWRIVNASRGMTFSLSLVPAGQTTAPLPFQVLAKDGVSIAQPDGHAVIRTQLLLMPATRVEIAIPAPPAGGTYILHNDVVQTGGNGAGDIWPELDLASFTWAKPATASTLPAPPSAAFRVSGPATPLPRVANIVDGARGPCTFVPGDTRVVYFVHRFVKIAGDNPAHSNDSDKPNENEVFGLIAGIRHSNGHIDFYADSSPTVLHSVGDVWQAGTHSGDPAFPAFGHNDWGTICTVKGNVEPWQLINFTGEDHNFHIHQTKFAIDPAAAWQFPDPKIAAAAPLQRTDREVLDFFNAYAASLHDTIPVPRGPTDCAIDPAAKGCKGLATTECSGTPDLSACPHPGKIGAILDFTRAEQVGSFVYHCHIMEHEDGGMMAKITVMCPNNDPTCAAQQARTAICRAPVAAE